MVYNESQSLKDTWFVPFFFGIQLLVIVVGVVVFFIDLSAPEALHGYMVFGGVMLVSMLIGLMVVSMKLVIRLDASGLSFKSPPFINSWKKYKWEEVKHIQTIKKASIWSGRGLGVHYSFQGEWSYIFSTAHVVRVSLKDSSFVWSTRNPDKILAAWEEFRSER